jgi:hypothetical protein
MQKGIDSNESLLPYLHRLKEEGCTFACRPYSHDTEGRLTREEADALLQAGVRIVSFWKNSRYEGLSHYTHQAGLADGAAACQQADALGQPRGTPIYFTVDYDAAPEEIQRHILPYFSGVREAISRFSSYTPYRMGVYGSAGVCQAVRRQAADHSYAAFFTWLAYFEGQEGKHPEAGYNILQQAGQELTITGNTTAPAEEAAPRKKKIPPPVYVHYNTSPGNRSGAFTF